VRALSAENKVRFSRAEQLDLGYAGDNAVNMLQLKFQILLGGAREYCISRTLTGRDYKPVSARDLSK